MKFTADLHIHSKYSRATAKKLDLEHVYMAAQLKGITVVATGDFTHPGWFSELQERLEPAEPGLFKLKDHIAEQYDPKVPPTCRSDVRFILVSEISNIYKKDGKTRKNHNLVFAPDFKVAEAINARLEAIGNIHSDGRPILGLDARDLLELVLEQSSDTFLIPAHIWTPWFSVLGSKSGFDSIEACFGDLSNYIFALETGLSSDPPMNWRISSLDRFSLVSNSDAHSPMKLGREANLFDTELSYFAIRSALETHDPQRFLGTFEFYPEEGKYHVDGHRKCQVRLHPLETLALDNRCPVCGKALTLGVLYRAEQLADRKTEKKPDHAGIYHNLIPLEHILAELLKVGPGSKKVQRQYQRLLHHLGPEFDILQHLSLADIRKSGVPLLDEAILRMREHRVHFSPGYDGEFGKVEIFSTEERDALLSQKSLFQVAPPDAATKKQRQPTPRPSFDSPPIASGADRNPGIRPAKRIRANTAQQQAITHGRGPLVIVAGPGTGKTFTITQRIFHLIKTGTVKPERILAVTFTRKAALEMHSRLETLLKQTDHLPLMTTFHGFCWRLIQEYHPEKGALRIIDPNDRSLVIKDAMAMARKQGIDLSQSEHEYLTAIAAVKQSILSADDIVDSLNHLSCPAEALTPVFTIYQDILKLNHLIDYEDVIRIVVTRFKEDPLFRNNCQLRFPYVFVDEYQDLNEGQYRIIRALADKDDADICVIGDPDQAIYGFRGSDVTYFKRFKQDYPHAEVIQLARNYRSTETILESSFQVIQKDRITIDGGPAERTFSNINANDTISIMSMPSERAEAVGIGRVIEQMIGGTGFHAVDFDKLTQYQEGDSRSFSDFAVLFRTHDQGKILFDQLESAGIPCQMVSRDSLINTPGIKTLLHLLKMADGLGTFIDFEHLNRSHASPLPSVVINSFKTWAYTTKRGFSDACDRSMQAPIAQMVKGGQAKLIECIKTLACWQARVANRSLGEKLALLSQAPIVQNSVNDQRAFQAALKKLVDRSNSYELDTAEFLSVLALDSDIDNYDATVEKVTLMTLHAAKGLEFPVVFIAGCEAGLIPFSPNGDRHADLAEERRLFYVGMTRAKERLFLCWASKRRQYGRLVDRKISPFVMDIEKHLQRYVTTESKATHSLKQTQLNLF